MFSRNGPASSDGHGRHDDLRVLVYHRVADPARVRGDPQLLSATPEAFDAQMAYLARRYTPVTAARVAAAIRGETDLPRRAVLVTFDDAYRDFMLEACGTSTVVFPGRPRSAR